MAVTIDELQIEIQAKGAESASGIDALTTSLAALKKMVNKTLTNKLGELSSALDKIKAPITVNMNVKGMGELKSALDAANSKVGGRTNLPTVDGSAVSGELDKISGSAAQAAGELEQLSSPAKRAASELKSAGFAAGDTGKKLKEAGASAKQGASGLSKFVSSLKRILMYRVVRSILSSIASAAKEGVRNLALYSKAIGGVDASRANQTMSTFATTALQVKNTLGAALMPVMNALMPVIQRLANWFIIGANAVNQFLAALTGSGTWTRAKEYAVDYADGLDKATAAAKRLNSVLAFDELNVIDPNAGGGGAGTPNYGEMFEEMEVDSKIAKIAETVKPFIEWIKENFDDISRTVVIIGAGLAAWKVASGVANVAQTLLGISKAPMFLTGLTLTIGGIALEADGIVSAIKDGLDGLNFAEILGGGGALALGAAALGKSLGSALLGGAIGGIVAGVPMFILGVYDAIKNDIDWLSAALIAVGATAAGAGLGALIGAAIGSVGGPMGAGIGALIGLAVGLITDLTIWIVQNWETVKETLSKIWEAIKDVATTVWGGIKTFFTEIIPEIINKVVDWFKGLPKKIGYEIGFVVGKLAAWKDNLITWIKGKLPEVIYAVVKFFGELPSRIKMKLDEIKAKIMEWRDKVIKWFKEVLPSVINSVIDWFKKLPDTLYNIGKNMIYGLWNGILSVGNWLWDKIKSFFGVAWEIVSDLFAGFGSGYEAGYISVDKFAAGGYPSTGELFLARESGPEMVGTMGGRTAVANNDQIVDGIREGVYDAVVAAMSKSGDGGSSVNVYLDGRQIEASVRKTQRERGAGILAGGVLA